LPGYNSRMSQSANITSFGGTSRIAAGPTDQVALATLAFAEGHPAESILAFDDLTGRVVDLDLRGPAEAVALRYPATRAPGPPPRGPGRPRLGVVAREVTLLPSHWDWLAIQRGGASAALRRLVEEARRASGAADDLRQAEERTYRFIAAMAGDLPGFEEATRALFAHDHVGFATRITMWPADVRDYAIQLLSAAQEARSEK
jgi:hypothetical protein